MSCLAIITARGGSKGVIDKNIRPLAGKPTIAYSIAVARACPPIDAVLVTTDSPAIRDAALAHGAEVPFLRPPELATDDARQEDAILHAMQWVEQQGRRYDLMCLLEPTAPLRRPETLERGFRLLAEQPNADAVFSVALTRFSPVFCNTLRPDGTLRGFIEPKYLYANRQAVPDYYKLATTVTICRWEVYKQRQTFIMDTTLALPVDAIEAIDIDEPIDFFLVERLIESGLTTADALTKHVNKR
jgi:N-acylneuraminate cytidylyltransferase/CMP-N,N'-diacetyllegionaminic acid synthase